MRRVEGWMTGTGQFLSKTHDENDECRLYGCVVHAPSEHPMRGIALDQVRCVVRVID